MSADATPSEETTELRRVALETALGRLASVADCVVRRRSGVSGDEWVAYVVPAAPFSPGKVGAELLEAQPGLRLPDCYALISALPYTPEGRVDEAALAAVPIVEDALAERAEAALGAEPAVERALAFVEPTPERVPPLHLAELLPESRLVAPGAAGQAAAEPRENPERAAPVEARVDLPPAESLGAPLPDAPDAPRTLPELLVRAARLVAEPRITYLQNDDTTRLQSFAELLAEAERICCGLQEQGVKQGQHVLLQLNHPEQILTAFWGCLRGGFVPAIAPVPSSYAVETNDLERLCQVWELLDRPPLLTELVLEPQMAPLRQRLGLDADKILCIERLRVSTAPFVEPRIDPESPAFLALTSGSTGLPKAIMLSHANIISRARGTNILCRHEAADRILNWLPFDHIGSISDWHLRCIELGCHMFYCTKEHVLGNPLNWLRLIDRFRISHSWAPNFAYALVNDALGDTTERWDLSCLKTLLTAGEAVSSRTVHEFLDRLRAHGIPRTALRPAFGMAELGSGVTYYLPTEQEPVRVRHVDRATLDGALRLVDANDSSAIGFTSLGPVVPGAGMRIVDEQNRVLPELTVGRLQISGGPVCLGYYRNDEANRAVFVGDGWFNTGDRGFLTEGELYLTGRDKETLIINGANYHNSEIEAVVEEVEGLRVSFTAACAVRPARAIEERLALFFSPISGNEAQLASLLHRVANNVLRKTGVKPDYLLPVEPHVIPKTGIGKIQRKQLTKRFEAGEFDALVRRSEVLLGGDDTVPDWFAAPVFRARAIERTVALPSGCRVGVLGGGHGLGEAVLRELRRRGIDAVEAASDVTDVVDVGDYASAEAARQSAADAGASLAALLERLRHFASALPVSVPGRYVAAAANAQPATAVDAVVPVRAAVPALLRAVAREHETFTCRHVDLPFSTEPAELDARAAELVDELLADDAEPEVAYRAGRRLVSRLERVGFDASERRTPLEAGAFYLVTGGLGGVGVELARHLLTHWNARVLLVGRSALTGDPAAADRAARLDELAGLGTVAYRVADVNRAAELELVAQELERDWGQPLRGVFHLAGAYHEALAFDETAEHLAAIVRPKLEGGLAVHALLDGRPDAFVLGFSSLASVFSGRDLGGYAAANRLLDAVSHEQRRQGRRSYVANWSLWHGLGMGAGGAPVEILRSLGYAAIAPSRGLSSLEACLGRAPGQVLVGVDPANPAMERLIRTTPRSVLGVRAAVVLREHAALDRFSIADRYGRDVPVELWPLGALPQTPEGQPDRALVERLLKGAGAAHEQVAPRTPMEHELVALWRDVLGVESLGVTDSFFDLGGTSLLSVKLFARISKQLGVDLTPAVLFQAPTIEAMAALLAEQDAGTAFDSVLQLADGPGPTALFLVHDESGDTESYRNLAERLTPRLPVYGLEPHGSPGFPALHTRFEQMVDFHVEKVRALQPRGPYLLGGSRAGGVLAFAVACRLQSLGDEVALVALFDAVDPQARLRRLSLPEAEGSLLGRVVAAAERVKRGLAARRREAVDQARARLLRRYLQRGETPPWFLQYVPLKTMYELAVADFRPATFRGRLTLLRALAASGDGEPPARELCDDPLLGWGDRATEGVALIDVHGGPRDMLEPPAVDELAARLSELVRDSLPPAEHAAAAAPSPAE